MPSPLAGDGTACVFLLKLQGAKAAKDAVPGGLCASEALQAAEDDVRSGLGDYLALV